MTLFRTVPPEAEPVLLTEAKQNLRLDHDAEDGLLNGLIRAAREEVEAACGLALVEQGWRWSSRAGGWRSKNCHRRASCCYGAIRCGR